MKFHKVFARRVISGLRFNPPYKWFDGPEGQLLQAPKALRPLEMGDLDAETESVRGRAALLARGSGSVSGASMPLPLPR